MLEIIFISVVVSPMRYGRHPQKSIGLIIVALVESTIPGLLDEFITSHLLTIRLAFNLTQPNPLRLVSLWSDGSGLVKFLILKV